MPLKIDKLITSEISLNGIELTPSSGLSYKVYTALLTQNGTDAPIAIVLENTLGEDIVWTRNNTGVYWGDTQTKILTEDKTFITTPNIFLTIDSSGQGYNAIQQGQDRIVVNSVQNSMMNDDILNNAPIEIRVYN